MLQVNCDSSPSPQFPSSSFKCVVTGNNLPYGDLVLNLSPTPSSFHFNSSALSAVKFGRILPDQSSSCLEPEKASCFSPISSILSNGSPTSKSSAELVKEIASLEIEILHLERYLLSLYQSAFGQHVPSLLETSPSNLQYETTSQLKPTADESCHKVDKVDPQAWIGGSDYHGKTSPVSVIASSNDQSYATTPKSSCRSTSNRSAADSHHRSLADHLGASCIQSVKDGPDKLSEDIVRCISSIYCKLGDPTLSDTGFSVSSTSSLSSTSTFSTRYLSDTWSPHCNEEATGSGQFKECKEERGPYAEMIEVLKICLDDESFNYAAKMLENFRSLVKHLEKVDPMKMKREEKLAFWINIHNALVMHAYLAYGTQNYVKSNSILKAAYNVGGHCINAYVIQSSILGIRSHYPAPWLQTLLSPGKKFKTRSTRHVYALEYPEPHVHFALSSGAFSDPAVRVYTAKNIFRDLRLAKREFIQSSVHIHKETRIYLPKILCYFAKDMAMTIPGLLETVNACLPQVKQEAVRKCVNGKSDKYIHWLSQSSIFRYVIHREVVEGRLSV